jgi:prevent-host-death family protein
MVNLTDIHSLTDFQRNVKDHLKHLKETGRPEILTVNGKAAVVVQDAESYQRLLDLVEQAEAVEGIQRGLNDVKRGRTRSMRTAVEELGQQYEKVSS